MWNRCYKFGLCHFILHLNITSLIVSVSQHYNCSCSAIVHVSLSCLRMFVSSLQTHLIPDLNVTFPIYQLPLQQLPSNKQSSSSSHHPKTLTPVSPHFICSIQFVSVKYQVKVLSNLPVFRSKSTFYMFWLVKIELGWFYISKLHFHLSPQQFKSEVCSFISTCKI